MLENLKNFLVRNKKEVFYLLGVFIIFICLLGIISGHQGSPLIDCGRETFIPSEILKGKILYKDIFNTYGPFAFQLNALIYFLFGEKLEILYLCGTVNSLIILLTIYLISRSISSVATSITTQIMIMTICVFSPWIFNYIFPYSYSVIYALSSFLLSLLFAIYYIKFSNPKFALLSSFFIGISFLSKQEYTAFLLVLAAVFLFIKPLPKKYMFYCLLCFIITPVISWSILFIQGLRISDCITTLKYIEKMSSSSTLKFFYSHLVGFFYDKQTFIENLNIYKTTLLNIIIATAILYSAFSLLAKKAQFLKFICIFILMIPLTFIILVKNISNSSFSWLPLSTVLIGLIFVLRLIFFIKKNQKIELKDKIFIFILISAILSSIKSFFFLNLQVYGAFMLPLVLLANLIFVFEYLPEFFRFLNKNYLQFSCMTVLLTISLMFSIKYCSEALQINNYPIKTEKGTVYTTLQVGDSFSQTINYINSNIPKNSTLLVIPEGIMLNFFTDRQSNDFYYFLIPVNIEIFNEESIIHNLSLNLPDYILINNRDSADYGYQYFGQDYGIKIYNFILKNYELKQSFGNSFIIKIYKRKH